MMWQALEDLPHGVLLFDSRDALVQCNAAARRLLSYLGDLLTPGTTFAAMIEAVAVHRQPSLPGGDVDHWVAQQVSAHSQPVWIAEMRVAEGEWLRIHDRALPGGGRVISLQDVSARKRADTIAAHRDRWLTSILNTVLDGIIVVDSRGVVRSFNPAAERLFGYPSTEIIGQSVTLLLPDPQEGGRRLDWDACVRAMPGGAFGPGKHGVGQEFLGRRKDGSSVPMELSISEFQDGDQRLFVGVARDASARKQAERALRDSEQRLALAMEGTNEGIVDWDPTTDHLVTGTRLRRVMGVAQSEVTTMADWMALIHPEDREAYRAALDAALDGPHLRFQHEARLARPAADGGAQWIRHRAIAVRGSSGHTVRFVGSVGDITQSRRTAEGLRAARNAAELANRAKSEFLANMSHELRTPLNAIIGFSELMMAETFGPMGAPQYGEYLRDVRNSGRHLLRVIDDILDVSSIDAGTMTLDQAPVAVYELMTSAVRLITQRAETAGVTLRVKICDRAARTFVAGDGRRLKQVLLNLLSNAVKFTPRGGFVTLSCECPPSAHDSSQGLRIEVSDTGIGMDPVMIPKLLKPFYRLEGALERRYDGVGLGLSLSRSFVELHGGTLAIDSALGQGTRVTVTLPVLGPDEDAMGPLDEQP